jgi:hypothetical protein
MRFTVHGGWELLVNWPMTAEMGRGTTSDDLHFDAAIARELFADPNGVFGKFDQEGLKQVATRAGRNGAAEAFLDKLWATLASRLTSGATATFFPQCALDILAGATTEPPKPDLVAGIFQQLHAAGTKVQGKLPRGNNQGPAATSHGVRSVVQLPEAERQGRVDAQRRVVSSGTPDSVLDVVATAISGSTGITFSDKRASHVKSYVAKAYRRARRFRLSASRRAVLGSLLRRQTTRRLSTCRCRSSASFRAWTPEATRLV